MAKQLPDLHWFPFMYHRFLAGTAGFSSEEVGAYLLLLIYQWEKGSIPNDQDEITSISRVEFGKLQRVLKKFRNKRGKLQNDFMEQVREEQTQKHVTLSERGKSGAKKRWHKHSTSIAQASASNGKQIREDTDKKRKESESTHAHTREEVNHEKTETDTSETGEQKKDTSREKITPVAGGQNYTVRNPTETEQQKIERLEGLARQYEVDVSKGAGKETFVRQLRGRVPEASMIHVMRLLPAYSAWWVTSNADKTYTGYMKGWDWYLQNIERTLKAEISGQKLQGPIENPSRKKIEYKDPFAKE